MSRGKYLSLEEARKSGKLDQFAKEHPIEDVHPQARPRTTRRQPTNQPTTVTGCPPVGTLRITDDNVAFDVVSFPKRGR